MCICVCKVCGVCACVSVYVCICVFQCGVMWCVCSPVKVREWLWGVGFSFCHVGPRDWTQVVSLGSRCLFPLRYHIIPLFDFWKKVLLYITDWLWTMLPWISWTMPSSCLRLSSARITSEMHHARLLDMPLPLFYSVLLFLGAIIFHLVDILAFVQPATGKPLD